MSRGSLAQPQVIGRYALYGVVARGGMATLHLGKLVGPGGFARTVAVKRLHTHFAHDPDFATMLLDEARVASHIAHPNVVSAIDVVTVDGELLLVMDFIRGESLSRLQAAHRTEGTRIPPHIVVRILSDVLAGLQAAHIAKDERGESLGIIHRDVSPHNILVGEDGICRLIDFGVAKARGRAQSTTEGQLKGKIAYMAPEQIRKEALDQRVDIYAATVVLWESLVGERLHDGHDGTILYEIIEGEVRPPSQIVAGLPAGFDAIVARGLAKNPEDRFGSALEMAEQLERVLPPARVCEMREWIAQTAGSALQEQAELFEQVDTISGQPTVPALHLTPSWDSDDPTQVASSKRVANRPPSRAWVLGAVVAVALGTMGVTLVHRTGMVDSSARVPAKSAGFPAASGVPAASEAHLQPEPSASAAASNATIPIDPSALPVAHPPRQSFAKPAPRASVVPTSKWGF